MDRQTIERAMPEHTGGASQPDNQAGTHHEEYQRVDPIQRDVVDRLWNVSPQDVERDMEQLKVSDAEYHSDYEGNQHRANVALGLFGLRHGLILHGPILSADDRVCRLTTPNFEWITHSSQCVGPL